MQQTAAHLRRKPRKASRLRRFLSTSTINLVIHEDLTIRPTFSNISTDTGLMGTTNWAQRFSALLLLASGCVVAKHNHNHLEAIHKRHQLHREQHRSVPEAGESGVSLKERGGGQCQFPSDAGLVAVAPDQQNAGWAMSPDQPCKPGNYCPYACPAGQVSMQWDPSATSYSYPKSMVSPSLK